jgi:hypothetical protein
VPFKIACRSAADLSQQRGCDLAPLLWNGESFGYTLPVHVEMRPGQFTLAVTSIDAALADHGLVLNPGPPSAELVVWTDDTNKAYMALMEKGAVSLSAPHDFLQSHRVAWVADPEGNPIHISGPSRRKE